MVGAGIVEIGAEGHAADQEGEIVTGRDGTGTEIVAHETGTGIGIGRDPGPEREVGETGHDLGTGSEHRGSRSKETIMGAGRGDVTMCIIGHRERRALGMVQDITVAVRPYAGHQGR